MYTVYKLNRLVEKRIV